MADKYLIIFTNPQTKEQAAEVMKTKTTRKAKVLDKIYEEFLKKYKFPITEVADLQMFKL